MQIVRPGFGPVLPGMRPRIGADEPLRPVWRGTLLVVPRQSLAIICTLVPEEVAKSVEPVTGLEQPIPIIMATLVAKVAQEGAIRFVHLAPPLLPLRVVGLCHVDGDHPVAVPSQHRGGL